MSCLVRSLATSSMLCAAEAVRCHFPFRIFYILYVGSPSWTVERRSHQCNDATADVASAPHRIGGSHVSHADHDDRGTVWVNTYLSLDVTMPFGGYKESGNGRELGLGWYRDYTEEKAVSLKL